MSTNVKYTKAKPLVAYKGFNTDNGGYTDGALNSGTDPIRNGLFCRGYEFEVGKTYKHKGSVSTCNGGFHACVRPHHVQEHYDYIDGNLAFALVHQWGKMDTDDDKHASEYIKVIKLFTEKEWIKLHEESMLVGTTNTTALVVDTENYAEGDKVVNEVVGAFIIGEEDDIRDVESTVPATLIGYFNSFKGPKGTVFVSKDAAIVAKVDGKKIKPNTKYRPSSGKWKVVK